MDLIPPQSWFSHLLPWEAPSAGKDCPTTSSTLTSSNLTGHEGGLGPARGDRRGSSQRGGISKCPI